MDITPIQYQMSNPISRVFEVQTPINFSIKHEKQWKLIYTSAGKNGVLVIFKYISRSGFGFIW